MKRTGKALISAMAVLLVYIFVCTQGALARFPMRKSYASPKKWLKPTNFGSTKGKYTKSAQKIARRITLLESKYKGTRTTKYLKKKRYTTPRKFLITNKIKQKSFRSSIRYRFLSR